MYNGSLSDSDDLKRALIYRPQALLYLKEGFKFGFGPFEFCLHLSCAVFIGIMLRFAVYL
jgi:hypothetical protein